MCRVIALSLLLLFSLESTGCYGWNQAANPVQTLQSAKPTNLYRVTLGDGRIVEIANAHVHGDSLLGMADSMKVVRGDTEHRLVPIGLPLAQVIRVERRATNAAATVLLAVALSAAVIGAIGSSSTPSSTGSTFVCTKNSNGTCSLSCPLIYSWDGVTWHLDSGTFGGAITPTLARTDLDNLLFARAELGLLQFRMTDEANETEHVDAFTVVAVDHPAGTDVAPDARANNTFHVVANLRAPIAARDFMGRDVLGMVQAPDARTWESEANGRDPNNPAHLRDGLELAFARPGHGDQLQIVVDAQNTEWASALMGDMVNAFGRLTAAWYNPATSAPASAPMARAQHGAGFLQVAVWDGAAWRPSGEIWEAGPEVAKRQVLPIDVSGIAGDTIRVRLESAPGFWQIDYVGLGPVVNAQLNARELPTVAVAAPRDTNALAHLDARDGRYLDMERGDTVSIIVHDTAGAPANGMVRSYLARTTGWYRVHGRDDAPPDVATMKALADGAHGAAKLAVIRMNQALAASKTEAARVPPR